MRVGYLLSELADKPWGEDSLFEQERLQSNTSACPHQTKKSADSAHKMG
jgi:hypothetical protein